MLRARVHKGQRAAARERTDTAGVILLLMVVWRLVRPLGFRDGGGHLVQWRLLDYVSRSDEPAGAKCTGLARGAGESLRDLALVITAPASCNRLRVKGGKTRKKPLP